MTPKALKKIKPKFVISSGFFNSYKRDYDENITKHYLAIKLQIDSDDDEIEFNQLADRRNTLDDLKN